MSRDLVWNVYDYSEAARRQAGIVAVDKNANYLQFSFAWGDTGTETGHTIDTESTDRTISQGGSGDYDAFLRFVIHQDENSADLLRTQSFRLKYQVNTGGYATIPTTASTNKVYLVDNASITHGNDTTSRLTDPSGSTFLSTNAGIADTSADTNTATFTQNPGTGGEHIEVLYSLRFQDAQITAGDVFDFRVVFGSGGDTAADTALDGYTVTDATLTWNSASTVYENVAAPDGTSTTTVDMAVVRALSPSADGVGAVTLDITAIVPPIELTATADGVGGATVSMGVVRAIGAQADGVGAVTLDLTENEPVEATDGFTVGTNTYLEDHPDWTSAGDGVQDLQIIASGDYAENVTGDLVGHWYKWDYTDAPTGDYSVSVDAYFDSSWNGTSNVEAGLSARVTGTNYDGYHLYFDIADQIIGLERADAGSFTGLTSASYTINTNTTYRLRLTVSGSGGTVTIKAFVDGVEQLSTTDSTVNRKLSGISGLTAYSGDANVLRYDNFEVSFPQALELSAAADGVGAASASLPAVTLSANSDGVGAATLDMSVARGFTAQADGTSTTQADLTVPVVAQLSANADGVAASSVADDQVYRRVALTSDGNPYGTSNVTAYLSTSPPVELTASPAGTGAAATTLYKVVSLGYVGEASGVATVTVVEGVQAGTQYSLTAAPAGVGATTIDEKTVRVFSPSADGVGAVTADMDRLAIRDAQADGTSSATVSMAVVRELGNTQADGAATTTSVVTSGGVSQLTAAADGVGAASAVRIVSRPLTTSADGTSTVTAVRITTRPLTASADGTSTVAVDLDQGQAESVQADGTSSVTLDMAVVRAIAAQADGTGAVTLDITNNTSGSVDATAAGTASVTLTLVISTATTYDGKYERQHALVYDTVGKIEDGSYDEQHAAALLKTFDAGV